MGIEAIRFGDGINVIGICHVSTTDAVFRTLDNKPVTMEFHPYCGPAFFLANDDTQDWMPDHPSPEWDNLWHQFEGWWEAKGKEIYKQENEHDPHTTRPNPDHPAQPDDGEVGSDPPWD